MACNYPLHYAVLTIWGCTLCRQEALGQDAPIAGTVQQVEFFQASEIRLRFNYILSPISGTVIPLLIGRRTVVGLQLLESK